MCAGVLISGCAQPLPVGGLATMVKLPVSGSDMRSSKEGHANCFSVLGIFAAGDCSVEKAAKNGGIVQINTVDRTVANVLGIVGVYTTVVRGN